MFKSIFGSKTAGVRYQGVLTPKGSRRFEQARARLARLYSRIAEVSRETEQVSDCDVMEYLACGELEAIERMRKVLEEEAAA